MNVDHTDGITSVDGDKQANLDKRTVADFGAEWVRFSYDLCLEADIEELFDGYFGWLGNDFWDPHWKVADFGCGSGRWAKLVAPKVRELWCIDASPDALGVAREKLSALENCQLRVGVIGSLELPDCVLDFAYSLGVLHHVPDTEAGLRDCVRTLKPGAPFLLYLYYALDNRPAWYRSIWVLSNMVRRVISRLPRRVKVFACEVLAAFVYWPVARAAKVGERLGCDVSGWPLSLYRNRPWYVMRNDALDRFGTRLEKRFMRAEMESLMERCGLRNIRFKQGEPFWVAIGWKA